MTAKQLRDELIKTIDIKANVYPIDPVTGEYDQDGYHKMSYVRSLISLCRERGFSKNRRTAIKQLNKIL